MPAGSLDPLGQDRSGDRLSHPAFMWMNQAYAAYKTPREIYADDVKCSHGATVGELDKKQLFYMQSRGIDMDSARTLLTYAFAAQVVEEIEIDSLREELTTRIAEHMHLSDI